MWSNGRVSHVSHIDGDNAAAFSVAEALCGRGVDGMAYLSVVPRADRGWKVFGSIR